MKVKIVELHKAMRKILIDKHFPASEANDIANVLLYAEVSGKNTQGIIKFLGNEPIQNIVSEYKPKIIKDTKLSTLIDGGRNAGILVSAVATRIAIKKCREEGLAIVGTNNTYSSTGALGYYVNEIAKNDFIGVVMSGTPKAVAPYGGIEKLLGINPIAFGFPTETDPIIFDMATAAITWYGLVRAKMLRERLPSGLAIDRKGNVTKDPEEAMKGAILTFGKDYKGSGLSFMIEMFTGPLLGVTSDSRGKWYNGSLFVAIDPNLLIGRDSFKKNSSLLIDKIKKSKPGKNIKKVLIPGQKALKLRKQVELRGLVEVDSKIYKEFIKLI